MCHGGPVPVPARLPVPAGRPARPPADVAALCRELLGDPAPRLTWYGPDGARVELTGRVLVTWVAKTAHQLAEEADLEAGGTLRLELGADWRAPVFWLAAGYLGAEVVPGGPGGAGAGDDVRADVVVVAEGSAAAPAPALTVVVPRSALPGPVADLPAGAVDHGEVNRYPDQLPAPGPSLPLGTDATAPAGAVGGGRVLLDAGTPSRSVVDVWAAGGSVVLHTGLDESALARVAEQERARTP
jgi:uncharacterized protein (TIGR03089 family)